MAAIHTNIPVSSLPTELTEPNKITTTYESFSLLPRLGPLSYAHYRNLAKRTFKDIDHALDFVGQVERHQKRWQEIPKVPALSAAGLVPLNQPVEPQPLESLNILRRLKPLEIQVITRAATVEKNGNVEQEARAESQANILSQLSTPNPVLSRLVEAGSVLNGELVVAPALLKQDESGRLRSILKDSKPESNAPQQQKQLAGKMVDMWLAGGDRNFSMLKRALKKDPLLKAELVTTVAERWVGHGALDNIESIDDSVIAESREWAFLRKERVELELKAPKFRGPLSLDSVAPESELTVTQIHDNTTEIRSGTLQQHNDQQSKGHALSSQIKETMGTLFDYGSNLGQTMSEQGYGRDAFKGEKRASVESTLRLLSEQNLAHSLNAQITSSSQAREYHTMGKDPLFATSEVAFEAFVPVTATHWLEAIQAVWCPRIKNPYLKLRRTIDEYRDTVEAEYLRENYVADPAEPLPTYEGIEDKSVTTKKIRDSDIEDGETYTEIVTISLSSAEREAGYQLSDDVRTSFEQDDDAWTNAIESNQYTIDPPVILYRRENSHIRIQVKYKIHDENFINPNSIWIKVSVTKFKQTQAYREQILEYRRIVNHVNPARREAIQAQAKKYARLKREELIRKYENNQQELQDYAFVSLMKNIFQDADNGDWSYYLGIIKSSVDWTRARIEPEPSAPEHLAATGLSPYHFLNTNAMRFFLPVHLGSEEAFFEALSESVDDEWRALFKKVRDYIARQREIVELMRERMNSDDIQQLKLDEYDTELVLGRHLEAVLSNHPFGAAE